MKFSLKHSKYYSGLMEAAARKATAWLCGQYQPYTVQPLRWSGARLAWAWKTQQCSSVLMGYLCQGALLTLVLSPGPHAWLINKNETRDFSQKPSYLISLWAGSFGKKKWAWTWLALAGEAFNFCFRSWCLRTVRQEMEIHNKISSTSLHLKDNWIHWWVNKYSSP